MYLNFSRSVTCLQVLENYIAHLRVYRWGVFLESNHQLLSSVLKCSYSLTNNPNSKNQTKINNVQYTERITYKESHHNTVQNTKKIKARN